MFENVKGHYFEIRGGVYGGVFRNVNDKASSVKWRKTDKKNSPYARIYNNNCADINVVTDENYANPAKYKVKNCTITGNKFASSLDQVEYESCTIKKLNGWTGIFKNCTITPGEYFRNNMYF